jgi:hypothetical protein
MCRNLTHTHTQRLAEHITAKGSRETNRKNIPRIITLNDYLSSHAAQQSKPASKETINAQNHNDSVRWLHSSRMYSCSPFFALCMRISPFSVSFCSLTHREFIASAAPRSIPTLFSRAVAFSETRRHGESVKRWRADSI